tara:strand:+ start:28 stop:495 length:468 start_codon:yes stop_codon:yes gene_type:complete
MDINLSPVGAVRSTRTEATDDLWDTEEVYIELTDEFSEESLYGLSDFSHLELIFFMDKVDPEKIVTDARHPRNRHDWPLVGIFAQRGKNRHNQLGLTVCKILKIEGKKIFVSGLDAVDSTPVLDIKPYVKEFGPRGKTSQPEWMSKLMKNYWYQS